MDRRNFIKSSCALCAGALGAGFISSTITGCATLPIYKAVTVKDKMSIPLSSFNDNNVLIVRNNKMESDILLVKKSESEVSALLMNCTHQDNALTATKNGLFCPAHGSAFDLHGNVIKEPALNPLKKFKTEINNQVITINLNS
jgi:Rieske Fe-S protein